MGARGSVWAWGGSVWTWGGSVWTWGGSVWARGGSVWTWGGSVWMWGADKWVPHRDHWARRGWPSAPISMTMRRSFQGPSQLGSPCAGSWGLTPGYAERFVIAYLGRRGFGDSSRPSQLSTLETTTGGISHRPLIWTHRVTMLPLPPLSLRVSTTTNEAVSAVLLHFAITLSITSIPIL